MTFERTHIPSLDEMLDMPAADLVMLRTRVNDAMHDMERQILAHEEHPEDRPDDDWPRRVRAAKNRYQRGIAAVNGVLRARNLERAGVDSNRLADVPAVKRLLQSAVEFLVDQNDETRAQLVRSIEIVENPRDDILAELRAVEADRLAKQAAT